MTAKVLVAYTTKAGSTQEIAQAIAARLREKGLEVEIQPMKKVSDLSGYTAVVLGAPLYMFHLLKDAPQFLSRNRKYLVEKPTAFFTLGPFDDVEKNGTEYTTNLKRKCPNFPGSSRSQLMYLAENLTRPN